MKPIPMLLLCPLCHTGHVDKGVWATREHKTHLCAECGHEWRPANVPTVGVVELPPVVKLGRVQREVLQALEQHGEWTNTGGWVWDTQANTEKVLLSLVKRGLVVSTAEKRGQRTVTVYKKAATA